MSIVETRLGGVVTLLMKGPEGRNMISMQLRLELLDKFRAIEADQDVRAVILTGGAENFCVGGDINAMGNQDIGSALDRMRIIHDVVLLIAQSKTPVIAAVEGWAVGAGFSLALLCDTIIAGDTARFKAGFGEIGLIGDFGMLHSLPARVGIGRAKQILLYSEVFSAAQALQWGLLDHVVPAGEAGNEAARLAGILDKKAPLPIAMTKLIFSSGLEDLLAREREVQTMLLGSGDHQEGKLSFLEKRKPNFHGN